MKNLLAIVAAALLTSPVLAYQDSDAQWLIDNPDHVVNPPAEDTTDPTTLNNGRDDDSDPVVTDPVVDTGLDDGRDNDQDPVLATTRSAAVQCEPTYVVETVTEIVEVEKVVYVDVPEYVEVEKVVFLPYESQSRSVYDAIGQKLYVYDTELFEGPVDTEVSIPFARFDLDPATGQWVIGELELPEEFQ